MGKPSGHINSVHDSVKFLRQQATQKGYLSKHKFPCQQCKHKASQKGHLMRHIKAVHEGVRQLHGTLERGCN